MLKKMGWGFLIAIIIAVTGLLIGWSLVDVFPLPYEIGSIDDLNNNMQALVDSTYFSQSTVIFILTQNLRAVLLAGLLGSLTFGLAGAAPLLTTFAAVGYLFNLLLSGGVSTGYMLALLLPHGIIELPALILATSATLYAAAKVLAPSKQKGIGEVWLEAIAVWFKITIGICIPAFILAAFIESYVTPQVVLWLF
jgi:stage II sporulation protein M